jgi:mono/diheme cytochrome c family protein
MAAYLMTIQQPGPATTAVPVAAQVATSGAALFAAACAGCHAPAAPMMRLGGRPGLARSSAVLGDDPANFIQTVLHGIPWERPAPGGAAPAYMPPFADVLSDAQVAELAAWVRTGAGRPAWPDVAAASARLRKEMQ